MSETTEIQADQASKAEESKSPEKNVQTTRFNVDTGLLSAQEYRNRRSDTLLSNPEAVLNEQDEIQKYFNRQDPAYLEEVKQLARLDHPMKQSCKVVIAIPAYREGSRINHTLEEYAKQDIDPNLYEIVLLDNRPDGVEDDNTASEVARFTKDHPQITVTFAKKVWDKDEQATVGNARKYAFDIALQRILNSGNARRDTILICNDADVLQIAPNYIESIEREFKEKPKVDALVTSMNLPSEALSKPNVAAGYMLIDRLERALAEGDPELGIGKEPATLIGRSSAMRASIYSAVGGVNPKARLAEDSELSWLISDARGWNPDRVIQFDKTSIVTEPRRHLDAIASKVPLDQMLIDFETKPELRQKSNDEVLEFIPDSFDWELFQDEVDSTWHSQWGGNRRFGDRFVPLFKKTMEKLGVKYRITEDNNILLENVDGLLQQLAGPKGNIGITHSQPIVYTQDQLNKIKGFFSKLPSGVIEARSRNSSSIM